MNRCRKIVTAVLAASIVIVGGCQPARRRKAPAERARQRESTSRIEKAGARRSRRRGGANPRTPPRTPSKMRPDSRRES